MQLLSSLKVGSNFHNSISNLTHHSSRSFLVTSINLSNLVVRMLFRLLGGWHKRWPSSEFDDVEAWDDVAQKRLMFLNHLQEQFSQQVQRSPTDADCGNSIFSLLNAEKAHLYIEVANGLMGCDAFSVSQVRWSLLAALKELSKYVERFLDFLAIG